jgi:protein FAM50
MNSNSASPRAGTPVSAKDGMSKKKMGVNASVAVAPKAQTKSALLREAQTRESLRKEFLLLQETVKATEINIPFVFYDGTNIPGGVCKIKKGDYVWVFLDRSRKVGAELGVGEKANSRREWARVGVDDLMMVRGSIIVPHVSQPPPSNRSVGLLLMV